MSYNNQDRRERKIYIWRGKIMKKFIYIICMLSLIVIISGCGKDEPEDPNDVLASYISKWNEKDFTAMYKMLTKDAKNTYDDDDFIERYEKLYSDLEI